MNAKIMSRPMFNGKAKKDINNIGIMQGFMDQGMDEPEEQSSEQSSERSTSDPEILMNNLRGDFRSPEARYMELAQMVGEEAASQTPPEVLAMLQTQLAQKNAGGIGALPGGQPPVAPPPPSGGIGSLPGGPGQTPAMPPAPAPGPAPLPQQAMPGGMAEPSPFPQGGAEQAPPTPDGLPPAHAATGMFVDQLSRMGPMMSQGLSSANQYLGRAAGMIPQFNLAREGGGALQAGSNLMRGPGGEIMRGAGTRLTSPMQMTVEQPTLTQGIATGARQMMDKLGGAMPAGSQTMARAAGVPMGAGVLGAMGFQTPAEARLADLNRQGFVDAGGKPAEQQFAEYKSKVAQIPDAAPVQVSPDDASRERNKFITQQQNAPANNEKANALRSAEMQKPTMDQFMQGQIDKGEMAAPPVAAATENAPAVSTDRLRTMLGSTPSTKSKIERAKELAPEYESLYKQAVGDNTEDRKMNALLLLADAGLKMARSRQPTPFMQISEGFADLPRGLAAMAAQAREEGIKVRSSAITSALSDISEQDKLAQAYRIEFLKGDNRVLVAMANRGGGKLEDAGMGGRNAVTRDGSFLGFSIDPKDSTVQSAIASRFTLRPTDNPFVVERGDAPTALETNKDERIRLGRALREQDNILNTIGGMKNDVMNAYSPGTWFSDVRNNIFVPVTNGLIRPDLDLAGAATRLKSGFNTISKSAAAAAETGRVSNQQQEWERENANSINDPTAFFKNPELAAKQLGALEALHRNARQQLLTQLGYESKDYSMNTPNIGTKNDPFIMPADPKDQKSMTRYLSSTIGKLQDNNATVYVRLPNGAVQPFNPSALRAMGQQ